MSRCLVLICTPPRSDTIESKRPQIVKVYGDDWFQFVLVHYSAVFDALKKGLLGGVAILAEAV